MLTDSVGPAGMACLLRTAIWGHIDTDIDSDSAEGDSNCRLELCGDFTHLAPG